ncbi:MAG: NnrS family protein [Gammaproteobacteria bacterium]|nr:MAG: NnrS family protein [Gammaproteobacteria bacterium]
MIQIQNSNQPAKKFALFELGFRPFFLGGCVFSIILMIIWLQNIIFNVPLSFFNHSLIPQYWHAHEMMSGFAVAIVAGFLLTAVRNWTGIQTINNKKLIFVFGVWIMARISFWLPDSVAFITAVFFNLLFLFLLTLAICHPLYLKKQYNQIAVLGSKIIFLLVADALFFAGIFYNNQPILYTGLILSLFVIIALVLVMSRRVVPFFIEKGLRLRTPLKNSKMIDLSSLFVFLSLLITFTLDKTHIITNILSLIMAALHSVRLYYWFARDIIKKPLLWTLYFGNVWIIIGLLLMALDIHYFSLSIHAWTTGTVALVTLGMMARVSLGHTGRNIFEAPKSVTYVFALITLSAISRVFAPLILPSTYYTQIISFSITLWIVAFILFVIIYAPILIKPRIDGQPG